MCDSIKHPIVEEGSGLVDNSLPTPPSSTDVPSDENELTQSSTTLPNKTDISRDKTDNNRDYSEIARNIFRGRLCASLCRELLKLGTSRQERVMMKEFVKILGTLTPQSWLRPETV